MSIVARSVSRTNSWSGVGSIQFHQTKILHSGSQKRARSILEVFFFKLRVFFFLCIAFVPKRPHLIPLSFSDQLKKTFSDSLLDKFDIASGEKYTERSIEIFYLFCMKLAVFFNIFCVNVKFNANYFFTAGQGYFYKGK